MNLLITWAVLTASMWVAAAILPKMEIKGGLKEHLVVSAIFGALLLAAGWAVHLVLGALSFGLLFVFSTLARILTGAIILKLTDALSDRLRIRGFMTALWASVIISLVGAVAELALHLS